MNRCKIGAGHMHGRVVVWITDTENPMRHVETQLSVDDVDSLIALLSRERDIASSGVSWLGKVRGVFA